MILSKNLWTAALALPLLAFFPVGCASNAGGNDDTSSSDDALDEAALGAVAEHPTTSPCAENAVQGQVRCHAHLRATPDGQIQAFAAPSGLKPADLQAAYKVPTGSKATIAIVDAQDDPNAEADLAKYRAQFNLPACTTANGCFKKVNQRGEQKNYPKADKGWAGEIALDIDMASAICPTCKIILVEADQPTNDDLGTAVNTAVKLGATVVSNSYGGGEDATDLQADTKYFNHPGVAIFASSGDDGFGVSYPASSPGVIGVGGTKLTKSSSSRGWAESAWTGAGSGCSTVEPKPAWQTDTGCKKKTVSDVSAVADPNTGVAVFDTFGSSGWVVFGGTSVASPVVASIFAATGNGDKTAQTIWTHTKDFNDVKSGKNGTCSSSAPYLCKAATGFDGPSGWGTPIGSKLATLSANALPADAVAQ